MTTIGPGEPGASTSEGETNAVEGEVSSIENHGDSVEGDCAQASRASNPSVIPPTTVAKWPNHRFVLLLLVSFCKFTARALLQAPFHRLTDTAFTARTSPRQSRFAQQQVS